MSGKTVWPAQWSVRVDNEGHILNLPLVVSPTGFGMYALDLMGQARWNTLCARVLREMIDAGGFGFDIILTAEAKAIGLAESLAGQYRHDEYIVLRKSLKLYMKDPVECEVQSITTPQAQKFYLGGASCDILRGRRVLAVDDVISTGGTMHAFYELSHTVGFNITAIAAVLTEGVERSQYEGIPIISLGHIPLPGYSAYTE